MTDAAESDYDWYRFNIDEAVPANREPCVSVVYPGTFDLPESRLHEETGSVNCTPNSSIL